jgi:hypothetical protein
MCTIPLPIYMRAASGFVDVDLMLLLVVNDDKRSHVTPRPQRSKIMALITTTRMEICH